MRRAWPSTESSFGRHARSAEVLKPADVAGRVAGEQVHVAVAVPVEAEGRREGSELQLGRRLLEIAWRLEERGMVVREFTRVLHEGHAPVLIADDQVRMTILIPVDRHGRDHLQVHRQRFGGAG